MYFMNLKLKYVIVRCGPGQNRVTWKTPSRAAFVPLQEPVAVLAILRSPHPNAGMKQHEYGCTQPLFRAGHDRGIPCVWKPKGLRLILIIMKHNYITIITNNGKSSIVEERILRFVFVPSIVEERILRFVFVPSIVEEQILWFVFVPSIV
jgi:hypothetical protein